MEQTERESPRKPRGRLWTLCDTAGTLPTLREVREKEEGTPAWERDYTASWSHDLSLSLFFSGICSLLLWTAHSIEVSILYMMLWCGILIAKLQNYKTMTQWWQGGVGNNHYWCFREQKSYRDCPPPALMSPGETNTVYITVQVEEFIVEWRFLAPIQGQRYWCQTNSSNTLFSTSPRVPGTCCKVQEGRYYCPDKVRLTVQASGSWQESDCYCFHLWFLPSSAELLFSSGKILLLEEMSQFL